jgi:hypothetical protein
MNEFLGPNYDACIIIPKFTIFHTQQRDERKKRREQNRNAAGMYSSNIYSARMYTSVFSLFDN